jgi:hypothetical protein
MMTRKVLVILLPGTHLFLLFSSLFSPFGSAVLEPNLMAINNKQ